MNNERMDELIIRRITTADASLFWRLVDRERARIARYFPITTGRCVDERACAAYVQDLVAQANQGQAYTHLVFTASSAEPVGMVMLKSFDALVGKCEVAYFVAAGHERKGIATGALAWAVDESFRRFNLQKVFLRVDPDNVASIRVAEKNGFAREGLLRSDFRTSDGRLLDVIHFGKLR